MYHMIFGCAMLMAAILLPAPVSAADESLKAGNDIMTEHSGESLTGALWLQVEKLRGEVDRQRLERNDQLEFWEPETNWGQNEFAAKPTAPRI